MVIFFDNDTVSVRKLKRDTIPKCRSSALTTSEQQDLEFIEDEGTDLLDLNSTLFTLFYYFTLHMLHLCNSNEEICKIRKVQKMLAILFMEVDKEIDILVDLEISIKAITRKEC